MADKEKLRFSRSVGKFGSPEDTRSHIEQDEYSITSSGASLEDSMFRDRDSVEYTRAKCTDTNAESDTCTSPCSLSTDELEIMRKQGAIPKHFRKALPPRPGPPPSEEVSLDNCKEDGSLAYEESRLPVEEQIFSLKKETEPVDSLQDINQKAIEKLDRLLEEKTEPVDYLHVLDPSKIKLVDGKYREKFEFIRTGTLGKGNIAGWVYKVKDNQTHEEHCLKTVKKWCFRIQELKCMVDLRHSCYMYVPSLYMFRYRDGAVDLHMEILNSITMREIIEKKVWKLGNLREPFAFYTLCEMLKAVSVVQKENWSHNDIHDENFMMQLSGTDSPALKLIDFGSAFELKNAKMNVSNLENEIARLMMIFLDAFAHICFNDVYDMKKRWTECLEKMHFQDDQGKKVLDLVDFAMTITDQFHFIKVLERVEGQLEKSLKDLRMEKSEFLKQVVAVLSTGKSNDGATVREEKDDIKSLEGKMAVLHGEKGDTNIENIKFPEEGNGSAPQELLPKPAL